MLPLVALATAFVAPLSVRVGTTRSPTPHALGDFKMPELPNPFGGLELPNPFGGGGDDFRLFPDDVQFTDVDGDEVILRKNLGKVDLFVNRKLRLERAVMVRKGDTLELTGNVKTSTPFSVLGFDLEDIVTEGCTPKDPAICDDAMALVA